MTEEYSPELSITEEYVEETDSIQEEIVELDKEVQKPKKPRTQKQLDALAKARETRKKNIAEKKANASIPQYTEDTEPQSKYYQKVKPRPKTKKVIYQQEAESSDTEEEIIYVKKPKRPKKKKKRIVYKEAESSSSEEEEVIEKVIQKPKRVYRKKMNLRVSDSEEEDAYVYTEEDMNYNYAQPLKYADVFRFA